MIAQCCCKSERGTGKETRRTQDYELDHRQVSLDHVSGLQIPAAKENPVGHSAWCVHLGRILWVTVHGVCTWGTAEGLMCPADRHTTASGLRLGWAGGTCKSQKCIEFIAHSVGAQGKRRCVLPSTLHTSVLRGCSLLVLFCFSQFSTN